MAFPSDEALEKSVNSYIDGRTAATPFLPGRRTRARIRNVLTAAYAVDEPKIRADQTERFLRGSVSDLEEQAIRVDQTRKIVEALREYEREDLVGIHVVLPADFIERKFGV